MKIESGDYSGEVTPVPIPNTVVKLLSADDTWWVTAWENRTSQVRKEVSEETSFFCMTGMPSICGESPRGA